MLKAAWIVLEGETDKMNDKFDNCTKLGDAFPSLATVELSITDICFPVRVFNSLWRNGIRNVHQLLTKSEDDLKGIFMNSEKRTESQASEFIEYIVEQLRVLASDMDALKKCQ